MKMLDLYSGEGLAAWGYWLSGRFTEIVGIDINSDLKRKYAFDFICGDAMQLDYEFLSQFDFIHASPPCQAYSKATPKKYRSNHKRLIAGTRLMLHATGIPHVIENVENSSRELKPNLVMDGHFVGLPITRRRYFYVSSLITPQRLLKRSGTSESIHSSYATRDEIENLMGLSVINPNRRRNLTIDGITQGIPPAMTKYISQLIFPQKTLIK